MKVFLCYKHSSTEIIWDFPFFPRIGEYISITELLTEKRIQTAGSQE